MPVETYKEHHERSFHLDVGLNRSSDEAQQTDAAGRPTSTVTITITDLAENWVRLGREVLTIDTTALAAPLVPVMIQPVFVGATEANASVKLYDGARRDRTAVTAAASGAYTAPASTALVDGQHTVSVSTG